MKILIAGPTFYPNVNGASYFTQRLAHYLNKRGHSVLVIAPSRFLHHETYKLNGVSVLGIRSFSIFINGVRIAQSFFIKNTIQKIIKEFSPDIIHLQSHLAFSNTIIKVAKELGIPVVGTNHFMPENLTHYLHLPKKIEAYIIRLAWNDFRRVFEKLNAVTAPTETGAQILTKIGLKKPISSISNGIDLEIFNNKNNSDYLRKKYHLPNKPTLMYLGRLDKEKYVDFLLKAFAIATKKIDAHFVTAGFGAEEANLKKLVTDLGIEKSVTFTGFVPDKDKPNLYRVADCFLIAGTVELQSIATMEAMASGLPIIAVNAMALPHLVKHGKNGFLFQEGQTESVAKHIVSIFSDKELRNKMSEESLKIIEEHDINKIIKKYESLYQKAIDTENKVS
jgi:glycosyltransferase involved in cell wall biosynthesis